MPIYFEFRVVLRIYNNHITVWKNGAHDERSRPMSLHLPRENMKPRVIQKDLIARGKVFSVDDLVMKNFSSEFCNSCVLVSLILYLL